jgi:hypothetical protein
MGCDPKRIILSVTLPQYILLRHRAGLCICKTSLRIPAGTLATLTEVIQEFLQSLQANAGTAPPLQSLYRS